MLDLPSPKPLSLPFWSYKSFLLELKKIDLTHLFELIEFLAALGNFEIDLLQSLKGAGCESICLPLRC